MIKIIAFFWIATLCYFKLSAQGNWITPAPNISWGRYDDISFANDSVAFIGQDNSIYKTSDKGDHWYYFANFDTANSHYIRSIEFMNDTVGFIGVLYSGSTVNIKLYKTTDGGSNWAPISNMQTSVPDGICGMAHYGNRLTAVGTWSYPAWFYRTDDLGNSWTKVDLSSLASGLVDCYMLNNDTILISGRADSANQYKATILKSNDGGLNWQRVYLAPNSNSYCWKLYLRPNGIGLASIENGPPIIARTTDFGDTWTTFSVYSAAWSNLGGIGLLNDTLGWVSDQGTFGTWETHDGGITWDSISSVIEQGDRMVAIDSNSILCSGMSVYKYKIGVTGIQHNIRTNRSIHQLSIHPNPTSEMLNLDLIAGNNTFGIIDIIDKNGQLIKQVSRQLFKKGKTELQINIKKLPAGSYIALWRTNELFISKKIEIIY